MHTDARELGFVPDDVTFDNTRVWNEVIKNPFVTGVHFTGGSYYFNSQPDKIERPFNIRGDGINSTSFIRNYSSLDLYSALVHAKGTLCIEKLSIIAAEKTSGGSGLKAEGLAASGSIFRDLYITGKYTGTFEVPMSLYSADDMGIRSCKIENVEVFSGTHHIAWLVNPKGLTAEINAYPAGGTVNHVTVQGYGASRASNISLSTRYMDSLYLYNTDNLTLRSLGTTKVTPSKDCHNIRLM